MQYSKYNHLIEFDGKKVLYNSNSNALIEIDDNFLAKIKNQYEGGAIDTCHYIKGFLEKYIKLHYYEKVK